MTLSETVLVELNQSKDEGRDVSAFSEEAHSIYACFQEGQLLESEARTLIDKIRSAPLLPDYKFHEPNEYKIIKEASQGNNHLKPPSSIPENYYDKVYGAWLGRCAGCLLGKPIEGWRRDRINGLLKDTGNYPVKNFISSDIDQAIKTKYNVTDLRNNGPRLNAWINQVDCGPSDDDTNYTVLYMKIYEENRQNFTSRIIADEWLRLLPFFAVCTAERVAYKNLINLVSPPLSGSYYNAYREWVGAQIRADFFGYVNPGNPAAAAELAWRDARISHVKNGIYGEMFVAAMIARAAITGDIMDIIKTGLNEIPKKSRLTASVEEVIEWYSQKITWEDAVEKLHNVWDEKSGYHWCHVISNAMICVIALLWGEGNFEKTMGIAICAGFDTDCNAATTGSVIGMILGEKNMPKSWTAPLNNRLLTDICGMASNDISELAARTVELCRK